MYSAYFAFLQTSNVTRVVLTEICLNKIIKCETAIFIFETHPLFGLNVTKNEYLPEISYSRLRP